MNGSVIRAYRLLLLLFPRQFRARRGAEMERLFRDMYRERDAGNLSRVSFWPRLVWDHATQAFREHISPSFHRSVTVKRPASGVFMSTLIGDVRYALRTILKQPGYAGMIVMMMALAIAGNAAVFRVFDGLFLRPMPFDHPEELVDIDETAPQWNLEFVGINYYDFWEWRRQNHTFAAMAAFGTSGVNFATDETADRVESLIATYDIADVLGIRPLLGRFFTAEEDRPDGDMVALLSYGFWQSQFGGDPGVLGRTLTLSGRVVEVIGVLPPEAEYVSDAAIWVPLQADETEADRGWWLAGVGRMKPGVTMDEARADLMAIHRGMIETHERPVNETTSPVLNLIPERHLGDFKLGTTVLLGSVGIVLLIACANIAGLMTARALARQREVGIRIAMGAGRGRIVRQLLVESLVLAGIGATIGTVLGYWGSDALVAAMADQFPAWVRFELDWRFVAFTLLVTVGAAIVFGLVPALQASAVDTNAVLSAASSRTSASLGKRRGMAVLVAGEVGLTLVLLVVAGLSVRDLVSLQRTDPGYETENMLSYTIALPSGTYEDSDQRNRFVDEHLARIEALPGVVSAAAATNLPLNGHWGWFWQAEGFEKSEDEENPVVLTRFVTPDYFTTLGVEFVSGRPFDEFDGRHEDAGTVIVNETFARVFLPGVEDPVGRRVRAGNQNAPWVTIQAVTRDVKHYGVDQEMRPGVYLPLARRGNPTPQFAVRASVDPMSLVGAIRAAVREMDIQLAPYDIMTMQERADDALWARLAISWLVAAFSTVALVLSVAGLYGVISYNVTQRVHEISIRMALGARTGQVLRQVMLQGMALVGIGVVAGLAIAFGLARVVAGILANVSATDPVVYAGVAGLLLLVGAIANLLPARRAARLEPMQALRAE